MLFCFMTQGFQGLSPKRNISNMNLKITEDTQNSKSDDLEEGLKIASRFLNVSLGSTLEHLWPETTFSQIQSMTS